MQTKLSIGEPGDSYEQEADRVADQVLAKPAHPDVGGASPRIQRYNADSAGQTDTAPSSVDHALAGPGRPLEPALRQDMEQRFGRDFSQVRVHSGAAAEQSARELDAQAYTVGQNIAFGAGRFEPGTHEGRRLIAHELTHVVQQTGSQGGLSSTVQRKAEQPGECDPNDLGTLGTDFHRTEAEVQKLSLPKRFVSRPAAPAADFVLYCPHKSTRPLKKLVPCSKAYWIGDAELSGKGKGKDEVWAKQAGEDGFYWGYVKKTYLGSTPTVDCGGAAPEVGPPSPTDTPRPDEPELELEPEPESEPEPEETEKPAVEPSISTGKKMRVNAPSDPGWAEVRPLYRVIKAGEPFHLPHFAKVMIVARYRQNPDYHLVFVEEGRYEGKDVMIHRKYLQDDPGSAGYADTRYDVDKSEFYYGGVGPIKTSGTTPERAPPAGVHELSMPDFPHDKGAKYGPYATSWFLIGDSDDKYLHPGFASLGCATIEIKMDDTTTWPAIWKYLIDARQKSGVVGKIEVISGSTQKKDADDPDPLGGRTTGPPGNRVWRPPGGGTRGGVPID